FGFGLEGLLKYRQRVCSGIINGIDEAYWNPATDPFLAENYDSKTFSKKKSLNKLALQKKMGLKQDTEPMLLAFIGRLVEQKGIDIILEYIKKHLADSPMQLVILGSGEAQFETALTTLHKRFKDKLGLYIGYNEKLAHLIEAGADVFLMPSRFEPCGLNQMYSMRYGTLPLVNRVGGLNDTVSHASSDAINRAEATGFILEKLTVKNLKETIAYAQTLYRKPRSWNKIVRSAMSQDFSWNASAKEYVRLYEIALLQKHHTAR
ncbi:MAG: glycogen synthase, partial [Thiohalomonadales bacterium]